MSWRTGAARWLRSSGRLLEGGRGGGGRNCCARPSASAAWRARGRPASPGGARRRGPARPRSPAATLARRSTGNYRARNRRARRWCRARADNYWRVSCAFRAAAISCLAASARRRPACCRRAPLICWGPSARGGARPSPFIIWARRRDARARLGGPQITFVSSVGARRLHNRAGARQPAGRRHVGGPRAGCRPRRHTRPARARDWPPAAPANGAGRAYARAPGRQPAAN